MFSLKKRSVVFFTATVTTAAALPIGVLLTTNSASAAPDDKVTICHATSSASNPYVKITVAETAVDGEAGNSGGQPDHYGEHLGTVFDPTVHANGGGWGDIIPPVPPYHGGLNWASKGQSILANNCNVPGDPQDEQIERPDVSRQIICGPDNNVWDPPADDDVLDWTLSPDGRSLKVEIIKGGVTFEDGSTEIDFGLAPDFNEPCPDEEIEVPAAPTVTDLCDPGNVMWNVPADTELLSWSVDENKHLVVEIIGIGVTFPGGALSHDFGQAVETNTASCGGEIGSAGFPNVTKACESLTIGTPTFSPSDATATHTLNGKPVKLGTHKVKPGEYEVVLLVNGEQVGAQRVTIRACGKGHNGGDVDGQNDLNNPAPAHTGR